MDITTLRTGDVIRCSRSGRAHLLEVITVVPDGAVIGRLPYASTYVKGGRYEASYRGSAARFPAEVVEVVTPTLGTVAEAADALRTDTAGVFEAAARGELVIVRGVDGTIRVNRA